MKYANETERLRKEVSILKKATNKLRARIVSLQATAAKRKTQMTLDAAFKKTIKGINPDLYKTAVSLIGPKV
jgi:uncharacterized protein YlxW (UPF0749 family)